VIFCTELYFKRFFDTVRGRQQTLSQTILISMKTLSLLVGVN
jgi:hypothetical protein